MINNLENIKKLMAVELDGEYFYHLQIIKRKKEHRELGSNSMIIKTYYITSVEHLEKVFPEIKCICDFHNARACINLNRRSFEKLAYQMLQKITGQIMNKDFKSVKDAYNSVCGSYSAEPHKKWIIDVDDKDDSAGQKSIIASIIRDCEPNKGENKVYDLLWTKNGYHIITKPFNIEQYKQSGLTHEIHKDNPTILYIP